jgi:competence protein ComEA
VSALRICALLLGLFAPLTVRAGAVEPAPVSGGVVNIGTASVEELTRLPGIGEKKAQAILDHRKTHPLRKLEDLTRVKGIGRKTVARLKPYLTVTGPTTLHQRPGRSK